jgi:hypothetical protein
MKTIFVAEETVNQYDSGVDIVGVYDTREAAEFAIDMYGYRNADIREYEVSTLPKDPVQTKKDYHALLAREKEERVAQSKKMEEECMLLCQGLTRPTVKGEGEIYKRLYESEMATLRQKVECICSNKYGSYRISRAWNIVENLPESTEMIN